MEDYISFQSIETFSKQILMFNTSCKEYQLKSPNKNIEKLLLLSKLYIILIKMELSTRTILHANQDKVSKTELIKLSKNKLFDLTNNIKWIHTLIIN